MIAFGNTQHVTSVQPLMLALGTERSYFSRSNKFKLFWNITFIYPRKQLISKSESLITPTQTVEKHIKKHPSLEF